MHARISLVIMYCGGIAESLDVCILIGNAKNIVFQSDSMMYITICSIWEFPTHQHVILCNLNFYLFGKYGFNVYFHNF